MFDLVIRAGNAPDIGIEGEFIAAVGHDLPSGKHEIDATRLAILPGMIDAFRTIAADARGEVTARVADARTDIAE